MTSATSLAPEGDAPAREGCQHAEHDDERQRECPDLPARRRQHHEAEDPEHGTEDRPGDRQRSQPDQRRLQQPSFEPFRDPDGSNPKAGKRRVNIATLRTRFPMIVKSVFPGSITTGLATANSTTETHRGMNRPGNTVRSTNRSSPADSPAARPTKSRSASVPRS